MESSEKSQNEKNIQRIKSVKRPRFSLNIQNASNVRDNIGHWVTKVPLHNIAGNLAKHWPVLSAPSCI